MGPQPTGIPPIDTRRSTPPAVPRPSSPPALPQDEAHLAQLLVELQQLRFEQRRQGVKQLSLLGCILAVMLCLFAATAVLSEHGGVFALAGGGLGMLIGLLAVINFFLG